MFSEISEYLPYVAKIVKFMSEDNKYLKFTEHLFHLSPSLSLKFRFASALPVKLSYLCQSKFSGI